MIELDHTALNSPDPPPPEPAKPILASQLLELEKKQRKRFTGKGRDERISTGCREIDGILGGGCERGIVVGISAEGGEGRLVSDFLLFEMLQLEQQLEHLPGAAGGRRGISGPMKPRPQARRISLPSSFAGVIIVIFMGLVGGFVSDRAS